MKLRQVFSVALVAAFACVNAKSIDLHVHAAADHAAPEHRHGPALHHHDAAIRLPLDEPHVTAVDADDRVVPVRFCAASTSITKPTAARCIEVAFVERPSPTIVIGARVVTRAHGPPSSRPDSLRAPPASLPA